MKHADIIQSARKYALEEIEEYDFPSLIHFEISEKKAVELSEKLKAGEDVVRVGICLMDVKLGEAFSKNQTKRHVDMSVEATKEFLDQFDLEKDKKEKVINCVEAHHKDVPFECLEAEICANADCYRFIHPAGFLALIKDLGGRGLGLSECLNWAERKLEEKHKILSLDICKKELKEYYLIIKKLIKKARVDM